MNEKDDVKSRPLTIKQRRFVRAIVEHGNGTRAVREAKYGRPDKALTLGTAGIIAHENLQKPNVKSAIERALSDADITTDIVLATHRRNMLQRKHLPTSQRAVETAEEMLGLKALSEAPRIAVAFNILRSDNHEGVGVQNETGGGVLKDSLIPTNSDQKIIDSDTKQEDTDVKTSE